MVYPTSGISIFAHIFIIATTKAKNFLGIKLNKKNHKNNSLYRIFSSFIIAFIIESIFLMVIISSATAVDVGILGGKSNLNMIKNILNATEHQKSGSVCMPNKVLCLKIKNIIPDASISLS